MARQFDRRICAVLEQLGYLRRENGGDAAPIADAMDVFGGRRAGYAADTRLSLTERGQLLRRLYSEQDLVLAQAIFSGAFDLLPPAALAAVLSGLVYEARRSGGGEPRRYPGGARGPVASAAEALSHAHGQVGMLCEDMGLEPLAKLDFGIVDVIYDWADGDDLSTVLRGTELTGGDFVRNAKRLADVLQQISVTGPWLGQEHASLADTAREATDLVNRGIVAYSGVE